MILNCLFVGFGGFLGAVCRYLIGTAPLNILGFPFATLLINCLGAIAIGAITAWSFTFGNCNPRLLLFLTVGICGGFTTFSTFSLEAITLLETGKILWGILYILFSVLLCLGGILIGRALIKSFFS